MKIYYFSQPLDSWISFFGHLDKRARHAGVLIDAPGKGLMQVEIGFDGKIKKKMGLSINSINEFHRQTDSVKGRWAYEVGETQVSFSDVVAIAERWTKDHADYQFNSDNCRAFTDYILRALFENNKGKFYAKNNVCINKDRFFNQSPCEEIEHRIEKSGFNVDTHIKSQCSKEYDSESKHEFR